jgi:hypothetical protein
MCETFFQPSWFHPRRVMESGRFGCSRSLLAFLSGFILRFRWIQGLGAAIAHICACGKYSPGTSRRQALV